MSDLDSKWCPSITEVNENQWNNVVSQSDRGTMFHRYEWIRSVEDGFDYEPRHVVVEKGGNPVAVMPNFVRNIPLPETVAESLPISQPLRMVISSPGFGGPVVVTDERDSIDQLFDTLEEAVGRRDIFHRLQSCGLSHIRYGQYLQTRGYEPTFDTCLFFIDLRDDWETIRGNMDKERRKDLRAAHEQEYHIEMQPLREEFETTYDYYAKNTERVGGDRFPRAFMETVAERLGDRVQVCTAVVDGEDVGRYVHLLDEEASVLRHWLSAIPDAEYYQYHPSELLHEHAIKWGIEHGYDDYGFGRTGAHFSNSVFTFKQKYGGTVVPQFEMEKGYGRIGWALYKYGRARYRRQQV